MEQGPEAPSAPSNLRAASDGDAISLEWDRPAADGDLQYNVYRSTDSIGSVSERSPVNSEPVGQSSFTDSEAERWKGYRYRVTAIRSSGDRSAEGEPSQQVRYTLPTTEYVLGSPASNDMPGFGVPLSDAGDIDGDGTEDFVVGNFGPESQALPQKLYLVSGADGTVLRELRPANLSEGEAFEGGTGVGDIDGDGVPDVLVGSSSASNGAGRVYLVSGADGSVIWTRESPNPEEDGRFGLGGRSLSDLNDDGVPDVLVAAPGETVNGKDEAGRAYLLDGTDGAVLGTLTSPDPQEGEAFAAGTPVPDIDGDGTGDLAFGAWRRDVSGTQNAGRVYLLSGADLIEGTDQALIRTLQLPNLESGAQFGFKTDAIPDVDGDGTPDILASAPFETVSGKVEAGKVYLMSGADGSVIRAIRSPHVEPYASFGNLLGGIEDVDGDGSPDIAIRGSESVGGAEGGGRIYLFDGSSLVDGESASESVLRQFVSPKPEVDGFLGTDLEILLDEGLLVAGANGESSGGVENAGKIYAFPLP